MTQPPPPSAVIAAQARRLRDERGWSARELAERMAAEGVAWDRSVVANLETGRRRGVSVEEWLALARVLDVAPIHLLVPLDDAEELAVTPHRVTTADQVRAWIRGDRSVISGSPEFVRHRPAGERDVVDERAAQLDELVERILILAEQSRALADRIRHEVPVTSERLQAQDQRKQRARAKLMETLEQEGRA